MGHIITFFWAAAVGMVRAGIQPGLAPGFHANVFLGGKLRFRPDLRLPVHGPVKRNSRGPLLSPSAGALHGMVGRNRPQCAMPSGSDCRPDATGKGLPGNGCLERETADAGFRLPARSRKSGNPCTEQSGKEPAGRIGWNQETTLAG